MKKTMSFVLIASQIHSFAAYALPDHSKPLARFLQDTSHLEGALVLADHAKPVVYVGPKASHETSGTFAFTGGSVDCTTLRNMREFTYKMPVGDAEVQMALGQTYYSPAFEAKMAVYYRNKKLIDTLKAKKIENENYIQAHKAEYGAYIAARSAKNDAEADLADVTMKISDENSNYSLESTTISTIADPDERRARMEELNARHKAAIDALNQEKREKIGAVRTARDNCYRAYRAWAPYEDQLQWNQKLVASIVSDFVTLQDMATASLQRNAAQITKLESITIGNASVSYNIFDNEVALVQEELNRTNSGASATRLPVFDVEVKSGQVKTTNKSASPAGPNDAPSDIDFSLETIFVPGSTTTFGGQKTGDTTGFKTEKGIPLRVAYGSPASSYGGTGAFQAPISQGAYCGAATETDTYLSYKDDTGKSSSRKIRTVTYRTQSGNVFAQDVALSYKYYAKAEPLSGRCTLNVSVMTSYWQDSGSRRSWDWGSFSNKSTSWDNTKSTYNNEMGLRCQVTQRPVGATPEESRKMNESLEKALYDDMFAMFVTQYGKSYTIEKRDVPSTPDDTHPFRTAGNAVLTLCGPHVACAITGLVLRTADEMAGSQHSGTTSSKQEISGTITRSFDVDSYFVAQGGTTVRLRVSPSN